MKFLHYKYTWIILLVVMTAFGSGCKKKIFSKTTFSGKVTDTFTGQPVENCSVALIKQRGSVIARNGLLERNKEFCRASTDGSGEFSMDLKWLDSRDSYYIIIYQNNTPKSISSNNFRFSGYRALESYVEFKIDL